MDNTAAANMPMSRIRFLNDEVKNALVMCHYRNGIPTRVLGITANEEAPLDLVIENLKT